MHTKYLPTQICALPIQLLTHNKNIINHICTYYCIHICLHTHVFMRRCTHKQTHTQKVFHYIKLHSLDSRRIRNSYLNDVKFKLLNCSNILQCLRVNAAHSLQFHARRMWFTIFANDYDTFQFNITSETTKIIQVV